MFSRFVKYIKGVNSAISETDGRIVKIGSNSMELTAEEIAALDILKVKVSHARDYLVGRNKEVLTCPDFKYVPSLATDIRVTMRNYIEETMPEAKPAYRFLFDQ